MLAYADFVNPFILHTDASTEGLGAVLYKKKDAIEHVVDFASRGLRNSKRNYPQIWFLFVCVF